VDYCFSERPGEETSTRGLLFQWASRWRDMSTSGLLFQWSTGWRDMSTSGLLFQWASTKTIQLHMLVQSRHNYYLIVIKLVLIWKNAHLVLNNNHSLTHASWAIMILLTSYILPTFQA
jgi:hypothetical protein